MKALLNEYVLKVANKYDSRSYKERLMLFILVAVFIYFLWNTLVYGYALATDEEVKRNKAAIQTKLSLLQGQIDAISQVLGRDPTSLLFQRARDLRQENLDIQNKITEFTNRMVSSKEMVQILRDMTERTIGLKVVSLESTDTKPLFPDKKGLQIYLHGIKLVMKGSFFDALRFLETIEQQRFRMLWNELIYEVGKYPEATIIISIYTLGLEPGWIGV